MPSAQNTVTISRPVDQVFAFVTDGENAMRWRPAVLDVKRVSGSGLGATFRQGVRGPGGRRIDADYVITAYEPGRRLAFRATAGPVRPEGEYVFEDLGGTTRLTFSMKAELGGWKRLLLGRAVQQTMDAESHTIERIEGLLGG